MAIRGRRPKAAVLHILAGTYKPSRHAKRGVEATGKPEKPKLKVTASRIWDRSFERWPWLTAADSDKLAMYAILMAEFEKNPAAMIAAKIAHIRHLGSELGGDPTARERIGTDQPTGTKRNPYFKD